MSVDTELNAIVDWYLATAYGKWEGPGTTPFYADPKRVGRFAVDLPRLYQCEPSALFRLLITLAMYQSRRDVDIMAIQREMPAVSASALTSPYKLRLLIDANRCRHLRAAEGFDTGCDVHRLKDSSRVSCHVHPTKICHVKSATVAIRRMGDLGKLSTSAALHLGADGFARWFEDACAAEAAPRRRAERLVERFSSIYRIGRKLASLFVSAVSAPELTGSAPWSPEVDGSGIVVVDANVARAVAMWRGPRARTTYDATERWLVERASIIDLQRKLPSLPAASPRLVQQALYVFRSQSNRIAVGDRCAERACDSCPSRVCPFRATRPSLRQLRSSP